MIQKLMRERRQVNFQGNTVSVPNKIEFIENHAKENLTPR